ncbi:MAG: pyridoxamine 5'-phosphate oxidase family protein [Spirochaetes bacterium]|nr:pyridoxamine 5'-phosphate oxidase family protein [Spirochaetota bacterium]
MSEKSFNKDDLKYFEKDEKVSVVATVNEQGLPHISLITCFQATDENHVILGQFCEGKSKANMRERSKCGFLVLSLDMNYWQGKLNRTGEAMSGDELKIFNTKPMWRYNSYFGIHTVHYLDVVEVFSKKKISIAGLLPGIIAGRIASLFIRNKSSVRPLNNWTAELIDSIKTISFISWIDEDGYPVIIPALQLRSVHHNKIIFTLNGYKKEIKSIKRDSPIAVYSLSLEMENVLLRGRFTGIKRIAGIETGQIVVDWVYNSMPPVPSQIYPPLPLKAVTDF